MPPPPRPARITILASYDDEHGQMHLWAEVGGKEVAFLFGRGAIPNRKVIYGLAHVEVDVGPDGRSVGDPEVVDSVPDADEQAVRTLLAEHLDRWEHHDHDWRTQRPPDRGRDVQPTWVRRTEFEGTHDVPSRAPEPRRPEVRRRGPRGA